MKGCHEEDSIHRVANSLCTQAGGIGTRVNEICAKMGISEATSYNWKKK